MRQSTIIVNTQTHKESDLISRHSCSRPGWTYRTLCHTRYHVVEMTYDTRLNIFKLNVISKTLL